MKTYKSFIFFVIIFFLISCNNENLLDQIVNFNDMPGKHINEMEIDNNNVFYYVASERDTSVYVPPYSSSIPSKAYLSKRETETSSFEILDDDFIFVDEILFDKKNNLWARNAKTIYLKEGNTYREIVDLPDDSGLFRFITIDNENNIWAGGEKFTDENSPINSPVTNIHVDKDNNIWLALSLQFSHRCSVSVG